MFRSWLLISVPTPVCLSKSYSCKACPGKNVCMKRVDSDKKASVYWSAASNKDCLSSRGRTAAQLRFNRGFCSCIGLNKVSLVRVSWETRKCSFDALEGTIKVCFLGKHFCRHPDLADPAPRPRCALRLNALFMDSTSLNTN